jgi:hypothetical protein
MHTDTERNVVQISVAAMMMTSRSDMSKKLGVVSSTVPDEHFLYFHPAVFVTHFCQDYITVKHSKLRAIVFINFVTICQIVTRSIKTIALNLLCLTVI